MEPSVPKLPKDNIKRLIGASRGFYTVTAKNAFDLTGKPIAGTYFQSLFNDGFTIEGKCQNYENYSRVVFVSKLSNPSLSMNRKPIPLVDTSSILECISLDSDHRNSFNDMKLPEQLFANITKLGFRNPLPIQKATFSLIENGCHVFGLAKTCGGKTAAFLIPVIKWIILSKKSCRNLAKKSPYCVVLSPTRELAEQSYHFGRALSNHTSCTCMLSIGGTRRPDEYRRLNEGCDIIFCTVGRLHDYAINETISLESLRFFVIDEVDVYFDTFSSFDCIREILVNYCKESRMLLFSATENEELKSCLHEIVGTSFVKVVVGGINAVNPHVQQAVVSVSEKGKRHLLLEILTQKSIKATGSKVIVFTNTKRRSTIIASYLCYHNIPAYPVNGDMAMVLRHEGMESFSKKGYSVVVATDVLSRGVDVGDLNMVINYDLPRPERWTSYVHRLGRTGRLGNCGVAITFYNGEEDIVMANLLCQWLRNSGQEVPEFLASDAFKMSCAEEYSRGVRETSTARCNSVLDTTCDSDDNSSTRVSDKEDRVGRQASLLRSRSCYFLSPK